MIPIKSRHQGVTILEALMVLVISGVIIVMSVRQYSFYKLDADIQQLKYNTSLLFQGAFRYYQANCKRQYDPTNSAYVPTTGSLDPANATPPSNPFPIDITMLATDGYLTQPLAANNVLVNNTGISNGYIVQLNQYTPNRTMVTYNWATDTNGSANIGTEYIWTILVAVELLNPANATNYWYLSGADCLSSSYTVGPSTLVYPCSAKKSGPYLVWEQLPSYATQGSPPDLWLTTPTVKQFTQIYSTYPILYLSGSSSGGQTYLCGS